MLALALLALGLTAKASARVLPRRIRDGWIGTVGFPSAIFCLLLVVPVSRAGSNLASGAWIAEQWFAPVVRWAPVVSVLAAAMLASWLIRGRASKRVWWRRSLTLVVAIGLVVLLLVDHEVVRGLYPAFHRLLEGAAAATAVVLVARVLTGAPRPNRTALGFDRGVALGGTACAVLLWFASSPVTRSGLVLRSSFARHWMPSTLTRERTTILRTMLAELDVTTHAGPTEDSREDPVSFDGRGDWNVVLVIVDTMRADTLPPARPSAGLPFARPGDTPRLDAWLEHAYRFERAYAPATETKRAMPAMLRSIEASEDPLLGVPIGERMTALELVPLAVTNQYFRRAIYERVGVLLRDFARVETYDDARTGAAVPTALELVESAAPQRFFLLLHLYGLHQPGFDGEVIPMRITRVEAYRRSLIYLDEQFGALLDGLESRGLREQTIIVLTSDHGEGLGDHEAVLHGPSVFDEDVRVPLAFDIPGLQGHVVQETAGTIDLLPTLVDLLGAPPAPDARGRSLLPLFVHEPSQREPIYYFENWDETLLGVVRGQDKVIFERTLGLAFRFDLERDPDELEDIHDVESSQPQLLRRAIELKPELVLDELGDEETQHLLRARLNEVDPKDAPGPELDFLARLVALDPRPDLVARCRALFEEGGPVVRILLARHLLESVPTPMVALMENWLESLEHDPSEPLIIEALARQHVSPFALDFISKRMAADAENGTSQSWEPWLRLIRFWPKPQALFSEPLSQMNRRVLREAGISTTVARLLWDNIEAMERLAETQAE